MPLDGKTAHHGGDVCAVCLSLAKSLWGRSFYVPAGTHLGVMLLTGSAALEWTNYTLWFSLCQELSILGSFQFCVAVRGTVMRQKQIHEHIHSI
jgi:hypothetical protein